jgi:hypothetical protein
MHLKTCHQCGSSYTAKRSDARTCSTNCRIKLSRGGRAMNRTESPSKRRREDELFDLHKVLCETYYTMPPMRRPGYLQSLIERAVAGDAQIKAILTNPVLVRSHTGRSGELRKRFHFRGSIAYPTLPYEAHRFTMECWGMSLFEALDNPLSLHPAHNQGNPRCPQPALVP